jgi:glycine oxidase
MKADVVVVGGGIIGLGIAYETARRGLVTVVVTSPRTGEATGAAAGMLAPVSEAELALAPIAVAGLESRALYPELVRALGELTGIDCDHRTRGALLVALHQDHAAELEHLGAAQRHLSLAAEWLGRNEVLAREPKLSPRIVGALHVEDDCSVNPRKVASASKLAFTRLGGTLLEAEVGALLTEGGRATGVTVRSARETERIDAPAVVLAAGAWSATAIPDLPALPLRPVKGQVLHLAGEPLLEHVVRTPDVYLVPRAAGALSIGASTEEAGFDASPTAGAMLDLLTAAWRALPGVHELAFVETVTGFRPALRDHLPAIGPFGPEGVFVATGHYRNGVLLMPITARWIADLIETGEVPEALAPFSPDRFDAPRAGRASA